MQNTSTNYVSVESGGSGVAAHVGLHALGALADQLGLGAALSSRITPRGERAPLHGRGTFECSKVVPCVRRSLKWWRPRRSEVASWAAEVALLTWGHGDAASSNEETLRTDHCTSARLSANRRRLVPSGTAPY
jgi:hypothetical protein